MKEVWKEVKDYDGRYVVSNLGRVKSVKRFVKGHNSYRPVRDRILKTRFSKGGYERVKLTKNCKGKEFYVHRLVATAFIPNPENKPQVNHIDSNRKNNIVENLEWMTAKENIQHGWRKRESEKERVNEESEGERTGEDTEDSKSE